MNDKSLFESAGAPIRSSRFSQTRLDTSSGAGASEVALVEKFDAAGECPQLQAIDRCRFFDNRAVENQKGIRNTR